MFHSLLKRFRSTDNLKNNKKQKQQTQQEQSNNVILCSKCYFVMSASVNVKEYIEMHDNFNKQFVDECTNSFIVTTTKRWKSYENCSALYVPLC
jgi:hypothetical protein